MPDNFASLFEFLPIGAYRSTPAGRMLRANPALVRLNGCDTEAELLARVHDLATEWYVEPGRREQFKSQLAAQGRVTGFESEVHRHKTRERIWISENAHAVRGPDGRVEYYEGTVEEVTERVRERQRLLASEANLAQMIDLVPGVVYRVLTYPDGRRRMSYVSASVKPLLGIEPEAVLADPAMIFRLCHPEDLPRLVAAAGEAVPNERPLAIEFRVVLDGRERWLQMSSAPAPSEDGAIARVGMFFDISAHKQAEQALREHGELWKSALERLSDGVWDWDIERRTGMVSVQGKALLGYRDDELLGDPASMDAITHPDDIAGMRHARDAHFDGRAPVYMNEHRIRCKDGHWKWVLSRGVVMRRDADGRPLRMIGTHTDIDADKQAAALKRERDRAAAADQAKTMLLSRVSHELRTPLNAILGFAQLLELEGTATAGSPAPHPHERPHERPLERPHEEPREHADQRSPAQQRYLPHILASGRHLLGLVDDILDLSAVQTGQLRMEIEPIDPGALADEVLAMFASTAAQAGVEVQSTVAGAALPALAGDRKRCKQILSNLVSNAIKFNRPGGWVRLSAAAAPGGQIEVSVQDSGPGLTAGQQARLFQPFERAGAERGPVAGTGLGLALSRQFAEAMGGRIEVRSQPGVGSVFTLGLPAAGGDAAAASASAART
ncbi:MAG: PAS domain-containing protein [Burkholderiales bacterium]|nr:PAS domain-containing protein [Burkholderiales bacterium]